MHVVKTSEYIAFNKKKLNVFFLIKEKQNIPTEPCQPRYWLYEIVKPTFSKAIFKL